MTVRTSSAAWLIALLLATPLAVAEAPASDDAGKKMTVHNVENLKWGEAPPSLPRGAKVSVLDGNPFKPGPFTLRLKMPDGYRIPPHWHSRAENVTVISGTLFIGMGDKFNKDNAIMLKTGGFHSIAAQAHHYAFTRNGAVVQIHGDGPFDITYINPDDNPDPKAKQAQQ